MVRSDMLSGLNQRWAQAFGGVDVLLFNPPYVPTPSAEVGGSSISAAWAGGKDGREVIDRLIKAEEGELPLLAQILSQRGVFYLIVVAENKPEDISDIVKSYGMDCEEVARKGARNEQLSLLRIWRP